MRVLASSTANAGHYAPLVPVLKALVAKGHQVLVVAAPGLVTAVEASGFDFRVGGEPPAGELADIWDRVPRVSRAEAAILVNREIFGRLDTAAMLPSVEAVCDEWHPDLVVHEPAEFASALAAHRRGTPHVQVAIGLAGVEAASTRIAEPALASYGGGFVEALLRSPYLTRFPASLDPSPYPFTHRFRERAPAGGAPLPDWWSGDDAPLVYVSFGTVAGRLPIGPTVYRAAREAVADLPVRVLLTMGNARDVAEAGVLPPNLHAESWVDQAAAIAAASLVVCHGGAGTTFGALTEGRPIVVVPLMADQFTNGRVVAAAGAGLVVNTGAEDPATLATLAVRLRAAIQEVLATPSYRTGAERVADEMRGMPALDEVVETLGARP
jgi:UDP:flavonoid glycosyltransferase YjiC (YdhE family)